MFYLECVTAFFYVSFFIVFFLAFRRAGFDGLSDASAELGIGVDSSLGGSLDVSRRRGTENAKGPINSPSGSSFQILGIGQVSL